MTGGTLGNAGGFTLGGDSGATLGVADENYLLDGRALPAYTREVATHQRLTLTFRVTTETLLDAVRTAKTDQNQITTLASDDGGFSAVDRAGGSNSFTLTPPPDRQPLRTEGTYHVARYEETLISQTVDEWDVEIEFVRDTDRTDTALITLADQGEGGGVPSDHWGLTTRHGTIVTDRVDAEFLGQGEGGVERFELTTRLTFRQAHTFETALNRIDGLRIREIPDQTNEAVDDTGGDMTITVDSPTADVVSDGDYIPTEWESTRLNDRFQTITVTIAAV